MDTITPLSAELADYLDHLAEAEALTASSRAAHRQLLTALAAAHPGTDAYALTRAQLLAWLNTAASRSSWQNRLSCARRFYQWAQDTGRTGTSPAAGLTVADCPHQRSAPAKAPGPAKRDAPTGPWAAPLVDYMAHLSAGATPASTRQTYRSRLYQAADAFPARDPFSLSTAELVRWLSALSAGREHRRGLRATLTGFYAWAVATGRADHNPAAGLPVIQARPGLPRPIPDHLLAQAYAVAEPRTRLVLRLAAELGMRRAEIARVHADDVRTGPHGHTLLVHGKGQRQRLVPLPAELARLIQAAGAQDGAAGWALPNGRGSHLSPERVSHLAGTVLPEPYSLHTLRHRFATVAYAQCHDLYAVQRLLGHANAQVTERYVSLDVSALRPIVAAVAPA